MSNTYSHKEAHITKNEQKVRKHLKRETVRKSRREWLGLREARAAVGHLGFEGRIYI